MFILISALDPDDPLAELLEDLLPDEPKAPSKSITQQPRPEKPSTPPTASLDFKTKTSKPAKKACKICNPLLHWNTVNQHVTFDCAPVS